MKASSHGTQRSRCFDFGLNIVIDIPFFLIIFYFYICLLGVMHRCGLYNGTYFNGILKLIFFCRLFGVKVRFTWIADDLTELKGKLKKVYDNFIEENEHLFVGISERFRFPDYATVQHPVDFFIKHYYDRFYPVSCAQVFSVYRRTNAILKFRLDYLKKYSTLNPSWYDLSEMESSLDEIFNEVVSHPAAEDLRSRLQASVIGEDFSSLTVDYTSAAGYPYPQGVKRADVWEEAIGEASHMLHDKDSFCSYMDGHVWYTTGRAKLQEVNQNASGRLIAFGGYASMLIGMLLVQPWSTWMNRNCEWCAVGMSWMHGGAQKFAEFFEADMGFAPPGYRYVSVDIKEWDTKLSDDIMCFCLAFYTRLMIWACLPDEYVCRFQSIFLDMISAVILFPLGYMFRVYQGMKSGWCNTANDNTLIHELVFRCVLVRLAKFGCSWIKHQLYGDDNFMLVPDCISDQDIVDAYAVFGLVVGSIHSSRYLGDVDFLSKYVQYRDGLYFVFRPAVETHARLLMPEDSDPSCRDRPDAVIASERALGHLLDNPFNLNVRTVLYDLLTRLRDTYNVHEVVITPEMRRKHPWRALDVPPVLPTVPDISFIEELYGVAPVPIIAHWPKAPQIVMYDPSEVASNALMFDQAYTYSLNVNRPINSLSKRRRKQLIKRCSPFLIPHSTYGTHAARLEFAINYFHLKFANALDLGSHPGACAHSLLKVCDDVVCVSLKPESDGKFCPYVFRNEHVRFIECDANRYCPDRLFDLCHDDVDLVKNKSIQDEIYLANQALDRARLFCNHVDQYLINIRTISPSVMVNIYETYRCYGYFDIVKPVWSNPWKCEFMLLFKKRRVGHLMRKNNFHMSLNSFLNKHAGDMVSWNQALLGIVDEGNDAIDSAVNPLQTDREYQASIERKWLIDPTSVAKGALVLNTLPSVQS